MADLPHVSTLLEKLMLIGWVARTHVKDGKDEKDNKMIGINFTALGLQELLSQPLPVLMQKVQASQGPLSWQERKFFEGFPMLARMQLEKTKGPPSNPRFQT